MKRNVCVQTLFANTVMIVVDRIVVEVFFLPEEARFILSGPWAKESTGWQALPVFRGTSFINFPLLSRPPIPSSPYLDFE